MKTKIYKVTLVSTSTNERKVISVIAASRRSAASMAEEFSPGFRSVCIQ